MVSKTHVCTYLHLPIDSRDRTIICIGSWNGWRSSLRIDTDLGEVSHETCLLQRQH